MTPAPDHEVAELQARVADLEQRLARLSTVQRGARSAALSTTVDGALSEIGWALGQAMPRVGEVVFMEWDRRRRLVRDLVDYRPRTARRVAITGTAEYALADLPDLDSLLREGAGWLQTVAGSADTSPSQAAYIRPWSWKALLQLPLVTGGRTLGVMEVVDLDEARPFTADEIELCEALAAQAALRLRGAQLFTRVRRMADHDALTGLANPRTFRRRVSAAIRSARARSGSVAVLVLDLDDFKQVNDRFGHAHGDRMLRRGTAVLVGMCRSGDTVGRLGGDELAMVLPGTDAAAAAATAERIVTAFGRNGVGVSVGVAAGPGPGATAADLIAAADRALLDAKSAGKRRVRLAS